MIVFFPTHEEQGTTTIVARVTFPLVPVKSLIATTGVPRSTIDAPGLRANTRSSAAFEQSAGSAAVLFAVVSVIALIFVQS